jgi:hypothetical protein
MLSNVIDLAIPGGNAALLALLYAVVVNVVSAQAQDRQAPSKEPDFFNQCLFRGTDASNIPLAEQVARCSIQEKLLKERLLKLQQEQQHNIPDNEPATAPNSRREPREDGERGP